MFCSPALPSRNRWECALLAGLYPSRVELFVPFILRKSTLSGVSCSTIMYMELKHRLIVVFRPLRAGVLLTFWKLGRVRVFCLRSHFVAWWDKVLEPRFDQYSWEIFSLPKVEQLGDDSLLSLNVYIALSSSFGAIWILNFLFPSARPVLHLKMLSILVMNELNAIKLFKSPVAAAYV